MNISNYYWHFPKALTPKFCDDVIAYANQQEEVMARTGGYGDKELNKFMMTTGMVLAKHNLNTFPAWKPKKCLDHVLYSKNIKINKLFAPIVKYSDHLPIIVDFSVNRKYNSK